MLTEVAIVFSASAVFALAATLGMRRYALQRLLDLPNARSSHTVPTPRGGGAAIVATSCLGTFMLQSMGLTDAILLLAVMLPGLAVAIVGFVDDHGHVPTSQRLLVHFGAAAWATYWLGGLEHLQLGHLSLDLGIAGFVLATLVVVWTLNLFNFMDGIDGIAGSEVAFVALSNAWLAGPGSIAFLPLLCLAGASTGFLAMNWPPARIFMGDVGSGFVGFTLGAFAIALNNEGTVSFWASAILMGVFLTDATVTLLKRLTAGERIHEAHRSHAYQWAARRIGAHWPVTLGAASINFAWLLPWAYVARNHAEQGFVFLGIALTPLAALALALGAGRRETEV